MRFTSTLLNRTEYNRTKKKRRNVKVYFVTRKRKKKEILYLKNDFTLLRVHRITMETLEKHKSERGKCENLCGMTVWLSLFVIVCMRSQRCMKIININSMRYETTTKQHNSCLLPLRLLRWSVFGLIKFTWFFFYFSTRA